MREQLLAILLEHPKIDSVSPESNLLTDFGLSPQEVADLVCTIEDELDIAIPDNAGGLRRAGRDAWAHVRGNAGNHRDPCDAGRQDFHHRGNRRRGFTGRNAPAN